MTGFSLRAPFGPAGSQPEAIRQLVSGLSDNERFQTLVGVTGSGKTFTMANVIQETGRPALVIAHNKTLAAQLWNEFREFFPENRVQYFVSYYDYYQPESYLPAKDQYIEKDAQINPKIEMMRLSATASILSRKDVMVVASVSCIYGLGRPEHYRNMGFELKAGERMPRKAAKAFVLQSETLSLNLRDLTVSSEQSTRRKNRRGVDHLLPLYVTNPRIRCLTL